jgi:hypothetical protein
MLKAHPAGPARPLPQRVLGLNSPVTYRLPYEDPAMIEPTKALAPAWLRFPGGTVANYFDWRTGWLRVPATENPSIYRRFLLQAQEWVPKLHPGGITIEQFTKIAHEVGAEIVFVPNLETSTVEEQTAWFKDMAAKGVAPRCLEMGNEFYIAILDDPETMRIFPDLAATHKIMKTYLEAFRPYLPDDVRVSAQAGASRLHHRKDPGGTDWRHRAWVWDDALEEEPWFDAVTAHMYPDLAAVAGPGALAGLPGNMDMVYPALIARVDEGFDRCLSFISKKLPNTEIWVTEWGPLITGAVMLGQPIYWTGMWVQTVARGVLSLLRHPAVTVVNYHALFFDGGLMALFRTLPGGGYEPVGGNRLLAWFHEAANGGAIYHPVRLEGVIQREAQGTLPGEKFDEVAAALLEKEEAYHLIAHNAISEPRQVDLSGLGLPGAPILVEMMETPDLAENFSSAAPPVRTLSPASALDLPPYSITRVLWEKRRPV